MEKGWVRGLWVGGKRGVLGEGFCFLLCGVGVGAGRRTSMREE